MSVLKTFRAVKAGVVPGVIVLALVGAGCGGGDKKSSGTFSASANADHFAGPTPLNVHFTANTKNADGSVHYRWRFDDGTQSEEQGPTHSFPRPGYYTVIMDARDEQGNTARQSLLLGAWPPRQWSTAQRTPLTKKGALAAQRVQQKRTDARRKAQREAERQRLSQGS
jgi:PKD domain